LITKSANKFFIAIAGVMGLLLFIQTQTVQAGSNLMDGGDYLVDGGEIFEEREQSELIADYRAAAFVDLEVPPKGISQTSTAALPPIRIMPLGDSITKGVGTCSAGGILDCIGYREDLWNLLVGGGYSVDFVGSLGTEFQYKYSYDNDHEGHGGYETANHPQHKDILHHVYGSGENWLGYSPADIILLHIGTNDFSGINPQDPNVAASNVNDILNKIDDYEQDTNKEVLVILARIIKRIDSPEKEQKVIEFNQALQTMVNGRGGDNIVVVDMETALNYVNDLDDKLHPNAVGYSKMANVWFPAIEQVINLPPALTNPGNRASIQDETVSLQIQGSDPENDDLEYKANGLPPGLTINQGTGEIHGKISDTVLSGSVFEVTVTADDQTPFPDTNSYNQDQVSFDWRIGSAVLLPLVIR
jgi:hypothetical protein